MLTRTEEKWLDYIEECARHNVRGKNFFRVTDILETAFALSEDKSYEILRNIMGRKNIGSSPEAIIKEYISMLEKGYGSIKEQMEILGGNKLLSVRSTAEARSKKFQGGTFIEALKEVYNVSDDDLMPLIEKYLNYLQSTVFSYTIDQESFNKFLESDIEELEKQAKRFEC